MYGWYPDKWWTEAVAREPLDGCSDAVLEDFLRRSRALIIQMIPEPDDFDFPTAAGFVSGNPLFCTSL